MKLLYRIVALTLSTGLVLTSAAACTYRPDIRAVYNISSTMATNAGLSKLSAASSLASDPYFDRQWALYNDGTFTVTGEDTWDIPDDLTDIPETTIPGGSWFDFRGPQGNTGRNRGHMQGSFTGLSIENSKVLSFLYYRIYYLKQITAVADADIDAEKAWDAVGDSGRDIIVAIIDTGVDYTNEELADSVWTNSGEIAGDNIDNDDNGYIDDVYGWDFYKDKPFTADGTSSEYDHATHIAGVIAAERNDKGIAGVVPNDHVEIMSIKVLGGQNGSGEVEDVVKAIEYAEKMGASICNLSFGTKYNDPALKAAIKASDMLFVCAAGNAERSVLGDNNDRTPIYPASFDLDNIISVANLTYDGTLDTTSNYGAKSVDIAAPGSYILSTVTENSYEYMTGTSMAAPFVTAVAAMLYSYRDDLSLSEVKDILLASADTREELAGKVLTGGILNAYNAVTYDKSDLED